MNEKPKRDAAGAEAAIDTARQWLRQQREGCHGEAGIWPAEVMDRYHRDLGLLVDFATDQAKQFRECANHHAYHNHAAQSVALRAAEILDRIIADIRSANAPS